MKCSFLSFWRWGGHEGFEGGGGTVTFPQKLTFPSSWEMLPFWKFRVSEEMWGGYHLETPDLQNPQKWAFHIEQLWFKIIATKNIVSKNMWFETKFVDFGAFFWNVTPLLLTLLFSDLSSVRGVGENYRDLENLYPVPESAFVSVSFWFIFAQRIWVTWITSAQSLTDLSHVLDYSLRIWGGHPSHARVIEFLAPQSIIILDQKFFW